MPGTADIDAIIALTAVYSAAQASILNQIAGRAAVGAAFVYQQAILRDINRELAELDRYASQWCADNIPTFYNAGRASALNAIQDAAAMAYVPATYSRPLQILIENASMDLFAAHRYVGRVVGDMVRQAGLLAAASGFAGAGDVKAALIRSLTDRGITAIRDRRGREIRLDAYAAMVARSTMREATNQAVLDQMQALGYDLVKMSSHATSCAVCIPYENRVYSISGKDKRFPPLTDAFDPPYANIHPNCAHVIFPYIEALDKNAEQTIQDSNRPYELDPDMQARVNRYKEQQTEKRKRRQDRLQWERYRTTLPDATPKTLSGFRRSKSSKSDRWLELERLYREARRDDG